MLPWWVYCLRSRSTIFMKSSDVIACRSPHWWDYSLLAEYKEFFNWIQKEFRRTESQAPVRMPQHLALLLEDDPDGYTTLSPAGQVFFSAFEKELIASPPILLSAEAKRFYERLDGTLKNRVDITFDKLRIDCLRTGGSGRVSPADCMVYPRGDCRERLFYYETAEGINVCEIAFHGENYEELMKRGVKKDRYIFSGTDMMVVEHHRPAVLEYYMGGKRMSKVLIAGIGTGRRNREQGQDTQLREYDSANYIIDNKEYQTDFVAQALIKHYRPDQVILTGTARSMWRKCMRYLPRMNGVKIITGIW